MKSRHLGNSGLRVSQIGLGCNVFGQMEQERAKAVIHKAIDSGVTLFDTADVYGGRGGSEEQIGAILGDRRKDIVLATKFAAPMDNEGVKRGGSRKYIMEAVEASLRRLKTDWIDLYQMHQYDPRTPIEETLRALDDLIRAGKVRYIGCSNHPAWRVVESDWTAKTNSLNRFTSTQNGYSLINRQIEADIMPVAE
ncbi:MAG TPA: aldo/keto reductase, partial [Caulobacterales bacterium]|nr:aldo/keto reductase [Caulobacterales bacterium]